RIEGLGARDRLLERGEVAHLELRRDRLATRLRDGGGDVDHDQAGDPLRVRRRERDRVQAAQAERDERRALPAAVVEEGADVGHEVVAAVAALGRPVGVAVAALIEGEDVVITRQVGRDLVPAVRGLRAAVEEQHGRLASRAPVEEVEAETVEGRGAVGGGGGHGSRLARRGALCPGSPAALTPARAAAIARRVIAVGEALATVCAAAPVLGDERVPLAEALGRVAAADVVSARAVPAAPNSAMDGFAVRHADLASVPARLRVAGVEPAGSVVDTPVAPGTAVKLFTGPVIPPRAADIRAGLARALEADVVLTSGGVSVGELDLVKDALAAAGVERVFWQVAQKPGRPLVFGRRGERLVFGLPGNPVSALVCFYLY